MLLITFFSYCGYLIFYRLVREFTPNVIEPSFGIGRILYSLIEHSYYIREGDEQRGVLAFKPIVAPTKVLIVPISHQDEFLPIINKLGNLIFFASVFILFSERIPSTWYK